MTYIKMVLHIQGHFTSWAMIHCSCVCYNTLFMGFDFLSVWGNSLGECCFASLATVKSSASDLITLCCSLEYFNNPCTKLALNFECSTSLSTFCLYIVPAFTLVYRDFILLFVSFLSMRNSCNSSVFVLAELGLWWLVLLHHCECRYNCYGLLITPAVDRRCPAYCTVHSFLFYFWRCLLPVWILSPGTFSH